MSELKPAGLDIPGATIYSGCTRTFLYESAAKGHLTFRKAGRRTIVLTSDLDRLLASLPPALIRVTRAE